MKPNQLNIKSLELTVHLGWPEQERSSAQTVKIDIQIFFPQIPKACQTDDIKDTVCYSNLIQLIQTEVAEKSFRLIEHFTEFLFQLIKKQVSPETKIIVAVTKFPSIPDLLDGVQFVRRDNVE